MFAAVALVVISAAAWTFGLVYATPADHRAIRVGAAVAYGVQLLTFAIARASVGRRVMVGWGIGMLVRFLTVGIYGLVVVKALALPAAAALLSLVTFFFISTLIEAPLLRP